MTMHTTDGSYDPSAYADPPTMPLRIPEQLSHGHPLPPPMETPAQPDPPRESEPAKPEPKAPASASAGRNGLIMALGTMASRALGFVRASVIAAALGVHEVGNSFNIANTLPNTVYMMLLGGVLSSVFVPELVHAAQTHKDGGVAYTDRLLTICTVALVVLSVGAFVATPLIVDTFSTYTGVQRDLTIALGRYCLPQIFFYGIFNLLGQVLNSRDRYGAMMWTPVLNNVVSIAVFGLYIVVGYHAQYAKEMSSGAAMLIGLGSTLGVVIQAVGLLPSLRSSGFRWRPRFDWRGAGLGKPLRSAGWALMLVIATQLSWAVISRLTTGAENRGGLGNVAYTNAYSLFVVPQSVITISMVTAILPGMSRAASAGEYTRIGTDLAGMLRSSAAMIITATALFVTLAPQMIAIAFGHGKVSVDDAHVLAQTLIAFAIGIPAFCAQYALARGFYAMGDARTPFWLTLVTTVANAGLSALAYWLLPPHWIIIGMAGAQSVACVLSVVITGWALGRRLRLAPLPSKSDATMDLGLRRPRVRSGLDGPGVIALHLLLLLACVPGAVGAHFVAEWFTRSIGSNMFGNLLGLGTGSLVVLVSLFLFARPLGAGAAVAPFARKLRIPYPAPAATGGKHRR